MTPLRLIAAAALLAGCENSDLGKPCGTAPSPVADPVVGEQPVIDVVRMERDVDCDSFACLTERGLHGYCTRTCKLDPPVDSPVSCTTDAACTGGAFIGQAHCQDNVCQCFKDTECEAPYHCVDGACRDDDCPAGFNCKHVQEVGPLADDLFCVFKEGCVENVDCEALGQVECRQLACFDACLCDDLPLDQAQALGCANQCVDATGTTEFHRLTCTPLEATCACEAGTDLLTCGSADLRCPADIAQTRWETGAVRRVGMCVPKTF